ncbi:MAG: allophanate hydrolase [Alteromonadaceae bacterium]|nr:allophanate hydrolase [Alteromonadaceae bacterium]
MPVVKAGLRSSSRYAIGGRLGMSAVNNPVASLDYFYLREGLLAGNFSPRQVAEEVLKRTETRSSSAEWTWCVPSRDLLDQATAIESMDRRLPFFGIPFSVKDNIHVEGLPITGGCPAYRFISTQTSPVVQQLLDMGALLVGKNTMDQFATGVVGVRSDPHPVNPFNDQYIPGGSSSGSGVVVAKGCVSFSLGSDTGGSGRVPAALCNIVGFKPTPHVLSNEGMLYANRSIDCIPIFARTAREADAVFRQLIPEQGDTLRPAADAVPELSRLRIAVPDAKGLKFFDDHLAEESYRKALAVLRRLGASIETVDIGAFTEAGAMLFEGAFISERFDSVGDYIKRNRDSVNHVVAESVLAGESVTPHRIWQDLARLNTLKGQAHRLLSRYDCLLTPTAGTVYRCDEVKADPLNLNRNMAYYTNFGNLLDLAVVSVPGYFREDGLPFGLSFIGPGYSDLKMLNIAAQWESLSAVAPGVPAGPG